MLPLLLNICSTALQSWGLIGGVFNDHDRIKFWLFNFHSRLNPSLFLHVIYLVCELLSELVSSLIPSVIYYLFKMYSTMLDDPLVPGRSAAPSYPCQIRKQTAAVQSVQGFSFSSSDVNNEILGILHGHLNSLLIWELTILYWK